MLSGLQFSSLIRAGFGICLELSAFLGSFVRFRSSLIAENLLLRKQLAFYQEHQIRPRRLTDAARISLVLRSRFCDWRSALVDRQTRNPDRLASPAFQDVLEDEIAPGQAEAAQKHPSIDCSNGGGKSHLGARACRRRVGAEAGLSGLTANGWGVLAEPTGQPRPLIAALEQLCSESHPIVASLRFPTRGDSRLPPVVRLRIDGNWYPEDSDLQCHVSSDGRLDVAAVS